MSGEWQPIETAPKDGTQILAWTGSECACVEYRAFNDGAACWDLAHTQEGSLFAIYSLTHWMPLPDPPVIK